MSSLGHFRTPLRRQNSASFSSVNVIFANVQSGILIAGCGNPIEYIFDLKAWNAGQLVVRHKIPYSDVVDLSENERNELIVAKDEPLCVGHSLQDLIRGQIDVGLVIVGFYEDKGGGPLDEYIDSSFVTKAVKL